jgi:hypothetical protein
MANILIIDDEPLMCQSLSLVIQQNGHQTTCAGTLAAGLEKNRTQSFDVIFLDVNMPDGSGLDCIQQLICHTTPLKSSLSPDLATLTALKPRLNAGPGITLKKVLQSKKSPCRCYVPFNTVNRRWPVAKFSSRSWISNGRGLSAPVKPCGISGHVNPGGSLRCQHPDHR